MNESRTWILVLGLAICATFLSWMAYRFAPGAAQAALHSAQKVGDAQRIVSLAPGITETLYALGLGDRVVGRSDYCDYPDEALHLPKAGTGLRPDYEALVRMKPELVLTEGSREAQLSQLSAITNTETLSWLTLHDAAASLKRLGELTGAEDRAEDMVRRFHEVLGGSAPRRGLKTLLVLGLPSTEGGALWYARRNSLHGRTLHAAGLRNAVDEDISGSPSISFERLVKLDPELIVVMVAQENLSLEERNAHLQVFAQFPMLKAVKNRRVVFLTGTGYFNPGPRLLGLVDELKQLARIRPTEKVAP